MVPLGRARQLANEAAPVDSSRDPRPHSRLNTRPELATRTNHNYDLYSRPSQRQLDIALLRATQNPTNPRPTSLADQRRLARLVSKFRLWADPSMDLTAVTHTDSSSRQQQQTSQQQQNCSALQASNSQADCQQATGQFTCCAFRSASAPPTTSVAMEETQQVASQQVDTLSAPICTTKKSTILRSLILPLLTGSAILLIVMFGRQICYTIKNETIAVVFVVGSIFMVMAAAAFHMARELDDQERLQGAEFGRHFEQLAPRLLAGGLSSHYHNYALMSHRARAIQRARSELEQIAESKDCDAEIINSRPPEYNLAFINTLPVSSILGITSQVSRIGANNLADPDTVSNYSGGSGDSERANCRQTEPPSYEDLHKLDPVGLLPRCDYRV